MSLDTDVQKIKTDPDRPPVAVVEPGGLSGRAKIGFLVLAVLAAIGWTMLAVVRGEHVSSMWFAPISQQRMCG